MMIGAKTENQHQKKHSHTTRNYSCTKKFFITLLVIARVTSNTSLPYPTLLDFEKALLVIAWIPVNWPTFWWSFSCNSQSFQLPLVIGLLLEFGKIWCFCGKQWNLIGWREGKGENCPFEKIWKRQENEESGRKTKEGVSGRIVAKKEN